MLIAVPFITSHEGISLKAYQDVVGVWTICNGMAGVKPGLTMTADQCKEMTGKTTLRFMFNVANYISAPIDPQVLAAHTSFAYNIGIAGYASSRTLKLTNAGDLAGGCNAMLGWYTAGGKDCRRRANNCYGLVQRRIDEKNLCLSGAK